MASRKNIEAYVIRLINEFMPDKSNEPIYRALFKSMNDKQFGQWCEKLGSGEITLRIIAPNLSKTQLDHEKIIDFVEKEFDYNFWQRVQMHDTTSGTTYITPVKYPVFPIPANRHEQHITDKQSLPSRNRSRDSFTGQVTSSGSALSSPEANILDSKGLNNILNEFFGERGGDVGKGQAMERILLERGEVSQEELKQHATGVRSSKTLSNMLKGAMLDNTLVQG